MSKRSPDIVQTCLHGNVAGSCGACQKKAVEPGTSEKTADATNLDQELLLPQPGERYTHRDFQNKKPLEWKHIAFVRAQYQHLPVQEDDRLTELTPYSARVGYRQSIHFTVNHAVAAHEFGNWDESRCVVIAPGEAMQKANGLPKALNAVDSYYDKQKVTWPSDTVIIYFAGDREAEQLREQCGAEYHFIRAPRGVPLATAVHSTLERLGYTTIQGGATYTEDSWFSDPLDDFGRRLGVEGTLHSYSDEAKRDKYFALEAWKFFTKNRERAVVLREGIGQLSGLFSDTRLSTEEREHLFRVVLETVLMTRPHRLDEYAQVSEPEQAGLELRATLHALIYNKLQHLAESREEWSPLLENIRTLLTHFPPEYWELFFNDLEQPWVSAAVEEEVSFAHADVTGHAAVFRSVSKVERARLIEKISNEFGHIRRGMEIVCGKPQVDKMIGALSDDWSALKEIPSQERPVVRIEF